MRVRRQWAEIAPPKDAWEDSDSAHAPEPPSGSRFVLLEFAQAANTWNRQGVALAETGQYDAALTAYEKAVSLNPNSAIFRSNLSRARLRQHRLEDAIRELSQACALAPTDLDYTRRLAKLHAQHGDLQAAESQLLRATTLAPDSVDLWIELYDMYLAAERPAEAVRVLATARTRFPDDEHLPAILAIRLGLLAAEQADAGLLESAESNLAQMCALRPSGHAARTTMWLARMNLATARHSHARALGALAMMTGYLASGRLIEAVEFARRLLAGRRETT